MSTIQIPYGVVETLCMAVIFAIPLLLRRRQKAAKAAMSSQPSGFDQSAANHIRELLPSGAPTPASFEVAFSAFKRVLLVTVVFSLFINVLMFVGPLYMLQIYDRVLASRNATTLVGLTVIAAFMLVAYLLLDMLRSRILVRAGVQFDERLRGPLFRAALKTSLVNRDGSATQALRDMDAVRETCTGSAFITLCDAPFAVIFVLVCFGMHWMLGTVALVGAIVLLALAIANEFTTRTGLRAAGLASNEANYFAVASVRNTEVIHALGMSATVERLWANRHVNQLGWQALASDRAGMILSTTKGVRQFLQVAILGAGAYLAINREISPGAMIAASIMMGRALAPVEQVVGQWKNFINARAAAARLKQLFAAMAGQPSRTQLPVPTGQLTVEHLVAGAPSRKAPILKDISFALKHGEVLAVIGPSGSGKSTLARAIVGVWELANGAVRIDGADIRHWDPDELGRHIGYLPQDVELFAGTVAQNIARLNPGASDADVVEAAKLAGVHDFIQTLPEGYDTSIGEGGGSLSGGQRQRIGLARAFFGNPRLIVLDEPNAHLDSAGEAEFLAALSRVKESGASVVLITHKSNLLVLSDRILLMVDGAVRSFGATVEVLKELAAANRAVMAKQVVPNGTARSQGSGAPPPPPLPMAMATGSDRQMEAGKIS
ncbi:MAG: type I secretion system permease/ATPase [Hyphomicrobiaceae bacterium]